MNAFFGHSVPKYKSDNITRRRRRILSETRLLISERGFAGFTIRELCRRAGIAEKTLYNAFGSKEKVIALAIRDYIDEFNEGTSYSFDERTLDGQLERLVKVMSQNMHVSSYTAAILCIYNSSVGDKFARVAIRELYASSLRPFIEALEEEGALAAGVTVSWFVHLLASTTMALTTDWSLGEIADEALIDRAAEAFLTVVIGTTRGGTHTDARRWLDDVRRGRASWVALRRFAEASPVQARDITVESHAASGRVDLADTPSAAVLTPE